MDNNKRTRDRLRRCGTSPVTPPPIIPTRVCLFDTDYEKAGIAISPSFNTPDQGDLQGLDIGTDTTFV